MPRDSPEKNTPRRLFGNSAGYSADSVVACVLPKKMQGGHSVEYQYYLNLNQMIISKNPQFTGISARQQLEFTTHLLLTD